MLRPKTSLETDLDARVKKAQEQIQEGHADLFLGGAPPAEPAPAASPDAAPAEPETSLAAAPDEGVEPPAEPAPAVEPAPAEPPAEPATEPAPGAEPPAEPPASGAEPAPRAAAEPEVQPPGQKMDWKRYRELERETRRLKRQLEAKGKPATSTAAPETAAPAAPTTTPAAQPEPSEDDPFGVKAEIRASEERMRAQLEETNRRNEEQAVTVQIGQQEAAFRQEHPDYDDALKFIVEKERQRYISSGGAFVRGQRLLNACEEAQDRDPRAKQLLGVIERIADEHNMTDAQAATEVAADFWIQERRQEMIEGARGRSVPVPQAVWEVANVMGYTPQAAATPTPRAPGAPAAAPAAPAPRTTAEQVRAQARASAAGKSLSSVSTGGADTPPATIRTLSQFNDFMKKDPVAARRWMAQREKEYGPNWHRELLPQ